VLDYGLEGVGLIYRRHALHDGGGALQPHARVDVGLGQRHAAAALELVELREHQVPHFHKAAALAVGPAVRFAAADLLAEVVVQLAARAAGAAVSGGAPEVLLSSEALYSFLGKTDGLPVLQSLFIVLVDGHPKTFRRHLQPFGDELPCPVDGLFLEIVSDAEVPQHLEEREVPRIADVVDIRHAEALLARGQSRLRGYRLSGEVLFELHHPRRCQQQGRVRLWNQRGACYAQVLLLLKKFKICLSNFVDIHSCHLRRDFSVSVYAMSMSRRYVILDKT
jgi:hypothetical protein